MSKTALFVLIDIMQALADVENMVFVFLGFLVQLAQVFLAELALEEFRILDALFFRA